MLTKCCPKCKIEKNLESFGKRQPYCRECKSLYQKENRDKKLRWQAKYRENNRDELREKRKEYYYSHLDEEKASKQEWKKHNRHKLRAMYARRRARLLQAIPSWADLKVITEFYKNCPEGYHVDHIIPLQGKNVCGLHVIANLQYLPAGENLRKGNRYNG
jgi:hypothetical protein